MARSRYMQEVVPPLDEIAPTATSARVVFVRSSAMGSAVKFMIIDQNGRFIGESTASSHFAVDLPPGEYLFIAEGENTAVMHANLAADHVYYAEVMAKMGILIARVAIEPIKPGTGTWRALPALLTDTKRFVPLHDAGQAELAANPKSITSRIENAKAKWAAFSADERAELSLEPSDGVPGEAGANVAVTPPPPKPAAPPAPSTHPAAAPPLPLAPEAPLSPPAAPPAPWPNTAAPAGA